MRKIARVVTLLAALLLTACGGGDDPTVAGPGTTADDHGSDGHSDASATCSPSGATVSIVASKNAFDKECYAAPANQAFKIVLENKDVVGHSLAVLESHTAAEPLFRADPFGGPKTMTFDLSALKAGTYAFHCEVHPSTMRGTFVVG